jgi:hypothetical protein
MTETAVKNFQRDNDLSVTGQLEAETISKLALKESEQKIPNDISYNTQNDVENLHFSESKEQEMAVYNFGELNAKAIQGEDPNVRDDPIGAPQNKGDSRADEQSIATLRYKPVQSEAASRFVMDKDTMTLILAILGVLLSCIAIGWNLCRAITGRRRLRVSCYIGNIRDGIENIDPNDYLVLNVINNGNQPVLLTRIEGGFEGEEFTIIPHNALPRMLQPGEYIFEYTDDLSVLKRDLRFLSAIDSKGNSYKTPRKQLRRLKKEFVSKNS